MNRSTPPVSVSSKTFVEPLEPRIAPAGLLNETKFTSVVVGGKVLLDASGLPGDVQGLSTAFGNYAGAYLLYLSAGKAVVYTTDLNGNGTLDPGEITGIALAPDSLGRAPVLTLFSDVKGDIVTNLNLGHGNSNLTDSDNDPSNGRDGRALLNTSIGSITTRTITSADLDLTVPGNSVFNRLALTHFSIYGNIISGGDMGGLTIDNSGAAFLANKYNSVTNPYVYTGAEITIGGIYTGSAANYMYYHFTQNAPQVLAGSTNGSTELVNTNVEGQINPYVPAAGIHGGDVSNVKAASTSTLFSIGTIATGVGGSGARGGNISSVTMHGDVGGYSILAGDGGQGPSGGQGGSIIDFSDLSTINGQSFIHTGNGGRGTLGAGGDGGTVKVDTFTNASDVEIVLGAGGPGFLRGGNGAGATSTLFTAPDVTLAIGGKVQSTWHDIGDVGNTKPVLDATGQPVLDANGNPTYAPQVIDFDGDGNGDLVYSTSNPDQVVIVFGDGTGNIADKLTNLSPTDPVKTLVLKVPGGGTPVFTVGDFNGDGKPDIAVASGDLNNFGGIYVYLNQIQDPVLNPINANNYTHLAIGDHPFSAPQHAATPTLGQIGFYTQAGAILSMAAGDFNGDGITDLVYSQRVQDIASGQIGQIPVILFGEQATSLNTNPARVGAHVATAFVNGSLDNGLINNTTGRPQGTGFFYPNATVVNGAGGVQTGEFINNPGPSILRASSPNNLNVPTTTPTQPGQLPGLPAQPESFFSLIQGRLYLEYYTEVLTNTVTHFPGFGLSETVLDFGYVDTNRLPPTPQSENISSQRFVAQDFQVADFDQDGSIDLVGLSSSPSTYLATFSGTQDLFGQIVFTSVSGNAQNLSQGGISLDPSGAAPQAISLAISDPFQTGRFDGFAVTNLVTTIPASVVREFQLPSLATNENNPLLTTAAYGLYPPLDRSVNALDTFYTFAPTFNPATGEGLANLHPVPGYGVITPDTSDYRYTFLTILTPATAAAPFGRYLTENGISLYSGNGGDSSNGTGGNAGAIGDGSLSFGDDDTTTSSIQLRYTLAVAYEGTSLLHGGNGGSGFLGGGLGGDITGASARYNNFQAGGVLTETSIVAGNGGNGIRGTGGRGGDISFVSIESGPAFTSGNGGNGSTGGRGGSILGNQLGYDTLYVGVTLSTGTGGQGAVAGGAGGTISRWDSQINGLGGDLLYQTGQGGSAAGGLGGQGGGILDSPLSNVQDRLSGTIALATGAGGAGLVGGNGGSITNFQNRSTDQAAVPTTLVVLTGAGGDSVTGNGGNGGNITGFQSNAIGITNLVLDPNNNFVYNGLVRIIAGDGGTSYGAQGGSGGNLSGINATATSTPLIAAAGAGGGGLTIGGAGGSISNSVINSAATQIGKLLVVAGRGGDALASVASDVFLANDFNVNDLAHAILAYGGASGVGGNGGSVTNFTQPGSTQTAVDIIAGNGGNTPNAGNASTVNTSVGTGGSVNNVILAGTLGSIRRDTTLGQVATPPIKSYSATDPVTSETTTTISQFVDFLRSQDSATYVLDDSSGNVGMVAGASGTVRGGQPASNGVNGQVNGLSAGSILSIVAGSVDRVAPVSVLSNISVTNPDGVLGADKSANAPYGPNGVLDYYNELGINVANLRSGYRLIDGAIFAQQVVQTPGNLIISPRLFPNG